MNPNHTWIICCKTHFVLLLLLLLLCGRDSSVDIATRYGLDGPGIGSRWGGGEIFRTRPDRPWGPPILLYNGYQVFPGSKEAGAWCCPPPPSKCRGHERVQLHLHSPSGPSWPVMGAPLPFTFTVTIVNFLIWLYTENCCLKCLSPGQFPHAFACLLYCYFVYTGRAESGIIRNNSVDCLICGVDSDLSVESIRHDIRAQWVQFCAQNASFFF